MLVVFKAADDNQAQLCLEKRKIVGRFIRKENGYEYYYSVSKEYLPLIVKWFAEESAQDSDPRGIHRYFHPEPFPMGTCLFYSHIMPTHYQEQSL